MSGVIEQRAADAAAAAAAAFGSNRSSLLGETPSQPPSAARPETQPSSVPSPNSAAAAAAVTAAAHGLSVGPAVITRVVSQSDPAAEVAEVAACPSKTVAADSSTGMPTQHAGGAPEQSGAGAWGGALAAYYKSTARPSLPLLLRQAAEGMEVYVSYAHRWAMDGEAALDALAGSKEAAELLDELMVKAGTPGNGLLELRRLLERPLTRVAEYEAAALDLQLEAGTGRARVQSKALLSAQSKLGELQARMEAEAAELRRRRTLRSVVARFKPGDADEILSVPGRELRHEGVLLKANKLGKLVRHYFLFNDLLLTAEALKGSRATSWISSHTGGLSGPAEAQHEAEALQLRKCKALDPSGGHLILPMEGKDDSFELHLPLAETTSKLWAASVEERSVWISQLRQVLLESRFPPATAMLPRRLCYAAIDGGAREELVVICDAYRRQAEVVLGGAHAAVVAGNVAALRLLLKRRPEALMETGADGANALHLAVALGKLETVEMLVAEVPSLLEQADHNRIRPLLVAAIACCRAAPPPDPDGELRQRVLERLLQANVNPEAGCAAAELDPPLLMCVGVQREAAAVALLEAGADPCQRCGGTNPPLPLLHFVVVEGFHKGADKGHTALLGAVLSAALRRAAPSAVINEVSAGRNALHMSCAAPFPNVEVISLLLAHGISPNTPDATGRRPLDLLTPAPASPTTEKDALTLAAVCSAVEVLTLAGARTEAGAQVFEERQQHTAVRLIAKQGCATFKARKALEAPPPSSAPLYAHLLQLSQEGRWTEDASTPSCQTCSVRFTDFTRRHHCRLLGIVVCDACSGRRACLPISATNGGGGQQRVSDVAFNMLSHYLSVQHAQARASAAEEKEKAQRSSETSTNEARKSLLGMLSPGGGASKPGGKQRASGSDTQTQKTAASAAAGAGEAMAALHVRGEKLQELGRKVGDLGKDAEDFAAMARQIRQRAEKNSRWF